MHRVAPAALVTARSLAQWAILTTFNLFFGLVLISASFGVAESRTPLAAARPPKPPTPVA